MAGFPSDFKGAYRQVPACPYQAEDVTVVTWDPDLLCTVFFIAVSQLFGSGNAPLNFSPSPRLLLSFNRSFTGHCFRTLCR